LFPPIKISVLEQLTQILAENSIDVRLTPPGDKGSKIRALYDAAAEGASAAVTDLKTELFDAKNFPVPLIVMGNCSEPCDISFDYEDAVRRVIKHLQQKHGHRKFALISAGKDAVSCGKELYRSFEKVLPEYGQEFTPEYYIPVHRQENPSDYAAMLFKERGVTAFLCENDAVAARLIVDLKLRNIRVPEDVAVIGNGCSYVTELTPVPLTSIYLPARKYAEMLCDMILKRISGETAVLHRTAQLVPTGLFIGGSCGCPAAELPQLYWEAVPMSLADQEQEICESDRYDQFMKYVIF
jgi:DNA-binding LacI/PurR family transcriptional regulator